MSRLTVSIPASRADSVNAALAAIDPAAANTFNTHPALNADGDPDTTTLTASWDLDATGHAHLLAVVAQAIESTGRTGTGRTAKTPRLLIGDDPATARATTAADLTAADLTPTPTPLPVEPLEA